MANLLRGFFFLHDSFRQSNGRLSCKSRREAGIIEGERRGRGRIHQESNAPVAAPVFQFQEGATASHGAHEKESIGRLRSRPKNGTASGMPVGRPKPPSPEGPVLRCVFFRTDAGNEPVRDWLRDAVPAEARRTIGADILTVQTTWPIGKPLVDTLADGIREVRSTHDKIEYRVIFMIDGSTMVLLHGFKKGHAEDKEGGLAAGATAQGRLGESEMNKHEGSTLESLFEELGELDEVQARAAKKILAVQAERRMKELGLTTTVLASRMRTSRNQVHRILDQEDAGITLKMLFRLAEALSVPLVVELGEQRQRSRLPARRPAPRRAASRSNTGGTKATSKRAPRRPAAAE